MPKPLKVFTLLSLALSASIFLSAFLQPATAGVTKSYYLADCPYSASDQEPLKAWQDKLPMRITFENRDLNFILDEQRILFAGTSRTFSATGNIQAISQPKCGLQIELELTAGINPLERFLITSYADQEADSILKTFATRKEN